MYIYCTIRHRMGFPKLVLFMQSDYWLVSSHYWTHAASLKWTPLALVSFAANCPWLLYVLRSCASISLDSKSRSTCVIFTCQPLSHVMSHMIDFPFGNDPSSKSIFVILSKIPEPQDPQLDLTQWSDCDTNNPFVVLTPQDMDINETDAIPTSF